MGWDVGSRALWRIRNGDTWAESEVERDLAENSLVSIGLKLHSQLQEVSKHPY